MSQWDRPRYMWDEKEGLWKGSSVDIFSDHTNVRCNTYSDSTEPPRVETLTYQAVLQNELLGKKVTEVPVSQ